MTAIQLFEGLDCSKLTISLSQPFILKQLAWLYKVLVVGTNSAKMYQLKCNCTMSTRIRYIPVWKRRMTIKALHSWLFNIV